MAEKKTQQKKEDSTQEEESSSDKQEEQEQEEQTSSQESGKGDNKEDQTSSQGQEKADKGEEVEVPEKFQEVVGAIENLSVVELSELVKVLEKRLGVSAQAPAVAAPAGGGGDVEGSDEEDSGTVSVQLTDTGSSKIQVIKVVKEITGQGLKEAKQLVEELPAELQKDVDKEEAEKLKKQIEEAGGSVEFK